MVQSQATLLRRVELLERGVFDLRIRAGLIADIAPVLAEENTDRVLDGGGNLLLPSLHEHHMHLFATAAAKSSVECGPPKVNNARELAAALVAATPGAGGWIRGTGFYDSVYPELDRHWLDSVCPNTPVRIQHRTGMLWVFNSAGLALLSHTGQEPEGAERDRQGRLTGRFYNLDQWLAARLPSRWPDLTELSANLAACGITHVTDTGVNNDEQVWQALHAAVAQRALRQSVLVMGQASLAEASLPASTRLSLGPLKLYLREVALPELEAFSGQIANSHTRQRPVAIHCATLVELHFALAAFEMAGSITGDRVEHASVADDAAIEKLAGLGITVVTQPNFIAERGDYYLREVEPIDQPWLYRGQSFLKAGVPLALGSDAPYGEIDPWAAMQAAVERTTLGGQVIGEGEQLTPHQALNLVGGSPLAPGSGLRDLAVGQMADLVLLDLPWRQLRRQFSRRHVRLTFSAGEFIYQRR